MSFMKPKVPKAPPAPNAAVSPIEAAGADPMTGLADQPNSLISTSAQGLKRKPSTQRVSLIGG
jgi:hypothetical protein